MTVSGAHPHTSEAAIVAAAGLGRHPALISVEPGAAAARIEALPFIATARVQRHWPDGVGITVTERVPTVADGRTGELVVGPGRPRAHPRGGPAPARPAW